MPAVVRGNAVVVVPSEKHPLCATDLYQVLDTSDLPGGVINIVTGQRDALTKTLVDHQHVDAMWSPPERPAKLAAREHAVESHDPCSRRSVRSAM